MTPLVVGAEQRRRWQMDGWCVLENALPADEIAAAQLALADLFPSAEAVHAARSATGGAAPGGPGYEVRWDADKPVFPFESMALNRLCVHDTLIDLAQDLLSTPDVRLYQGLASAKYFDGHPDYEQLLHVDYGNHTLVVPRPDIGFQHLELFVYLSDVTPARAATRVVSRRLTGDIPVERIYLGLDDYAPLYAAEEPASGPAGSVLAYRPDVYHRGTVADRGGVRPLSAPCGLQAGGDGLARLPGVAAGGRGESLAPVHAARQPPAADRPGVPRAGPSLLERGDPGRGGRPLSAPGHESLAPRRLVLT